MSSRNNTDCPHEDEPDCSPHATKEDRKLIQLLDALRVLRTVRKPGEGKLTLQSAINAAIYQGEAFSEWRESGTPIGQVEVWVEGLTVVTVNPVPPTDLENFSFTVPSPEDAVLQVVRADENEKRVVLLNLHLKSVPENGRRYAELLPNGQQIILEIKPEESGKFNVRVEFTPAVEPSSNTVGKESGVSARNMSKGKAAAARANSNNVYSISKPLTRRSRSIALAASISLGLIGLGFFLGNATDAPNNMRGGAVRPNLNQNNMAHTKDVANSSQPAFEEKASPVKDNQDLLIRATHTLLAVWGVDRSKKTNNLSLKGPRAVVTVKAAESPIVVGEIKEASSLNRKENLPTDTAANWYTFRQSRLAALKTIYVQTDISVDTTKQRELLHSFVKALQGMEQMTVLGPNDQGRADAVITIRFEPDDQCLGIVFADLRDRDGKFLWQEYATCQGKPNLHQDTLFDDVSERLVAKLEKSIAGVQQVEQFAANNSRP